MGVLCVSAPFLDVNFFGPPVFSPEDTRWMVRALELAERGRLEAHPNPLVGCVIVKNGRAVGEGGHDRFGGPHAETAALRRAGRRARGATLYVTLEPCSRWGKTPPCTRAVIAAGLKRVVVAARDPGLRGRGLAELRRARLRVEAGLLVDQAWRQNAAFFKRVTQGLPYVILKSAQTLDGKTASRTGVSRWITGPAARRLGHRLRAQSDAVLVGGETVRRDNPSLTSHHRGPDPLRLVLSSSLNLSLRAKVFKTGAPAWVLTRESAPPSRVKAWERTGAQVLKCRARGRNVDLRRAFRRLAALGLGQILVEGGGRTAAAVLAEGLADEAYIFIAPKFLGGRRAPTGISGRGWADPLTAPGLRDLGVARVGNDLLVHGYF